MDALIYKTVDQLTMLCGSESWPMSARDEKRMSPTKMKMLRWACEPTAISKK